MRVQCVYFSNPLKAKYLHFLNPVFCLDFGHFTKLNTDTLQCICNVICHFDVTAYVEVARVFVECVEDEIGHFLFKYVLDISLQKYKILCTYFRANVKSLGLVYSTFKGIKASQNITQIAIPEKILRIAKY